MIRLNPHRIVVTGLLTCIVLIPLNASAWGKEGHHLIVEIAESQFTAAATAEVNRLLELEPGSILSTISMGTTLLLPCSPGPRLGPMEVIGAQNDAAMLQTPGPRDAAPST